MTDDDKNRVTPQESDEYDPPKTKKDTWRKTYKFIYIKQISIGIQFIIICLTIISIILKQILINYFLYLIFLVKNKKVFLITLLI